MKTKYLIERNSLTDIALLRNLIESCSEISTSDIPSVYKKISDIFLKNAIQLDLEKSAKNYIRFSVGLSGEVSPAMVEMDDTLKWNMLDIEQMGQQTESMDRDLLAAAGISCLVSRLKWSKEEKLIAGARVLESFIEQNDLWPEEYWINEE